MRCESDFTRIIISRYNESLDWVKSLKFKYTIYNKGEDIDLPFIKLENVGREAQTFLYHIVENYDNLDEINIFLQGNPFDHFSSLLEFLNDFPINLSKAKFFSQGCLGLADRILEEDLETCHSYKVYPEEIQQVAFNKTGTKFCFANGAQHVVHRNNIVKHSRSFYEKLLSDIDWNGHAPWSIERIWPEIFN